MASRAVRHAGLLGFPATIRDGPGPQWSDVLGHVGGVALRRTALASGMLCQVARWLGVDVGGKRKGFDVALIDDRRIRALARGVRREPVIELVETDRRPPRYGQSGRDVEVAIIGTLLPWAVFGAARDAQSAD